MKTHFSSTVQTIKRTALAAAIVLIIISSSLTASAESLGKIMPLGDSLTSGTGYGSYRGPLCEKLVAAGYTARTDFQFVGSSTNSYNSYEQSVLDAYGQRNHEGHGGYRIEGATINNEWKAGLSENLYNWIGPNGASPDIILLMAGTNELGDVNFNTTAPQHIDDLINDIFGYRPNVELYVGSLTYRANDGYHDKIAAFNAALPGIVGDYLADGKNIHLVDMYPVLTDSDLIDSVHPNTVGCAKLADAWLTAIEAPEPSSIILLLMGAVMLAGFRKKRR